MFCSDISAPFLLIFSSNVPDLMYYHHIPTAVIALILGFYVYKKADKKNKLAGLVLFLTSILFFTWSFLDLILWTNIQTERIGFVWSIINFIELMTAALTVYFAYLFLEKKDASFNYKALFVMLLLSFAVFIPTHYNLSSFDLYICESKDGPLVYYYYFLDFFFFLWLLIYLIKKNIKASIEERRPILVFTIGILLFLFSFSGSNFLGNITKEWELAQYGLFGMPIFMGFLVYLIVNYKAFNIRLLGARILVIAVFSLVLSQLFFVQTMTNRVLTLVTLFLISIFGWWLIKSVEQETKQKEQLEVANIELMKLDKAKNDFINIASHQLRTPISVIQGVASMLIDGDIDKMPVEEKQRFYEAIWIKSKKLQTIINDILNASKIDNKVSEMDQVEEVDLKEVLNKVVSDFFLEAKERNIALTLDVPKKPISIITGQKKYLEEVFVNLVNNAIKYTPSSVMTNDVRKVRANGGQAKIQVKIKESKDKILIQVKDNGIGIPEKSANSLFKKFSRADNAVKMYTDGSGLGLYIVKEIIEDHGGKVWFESEVNKGTIFFVELPIKTSKVSDVRKRILENK